MDFPHAKREPAEYGHSPGNGMTDIPLSKAPIATEGEATPGPDDVNPYDEREFQQAKRGRSGVSMPEFESRSPTSGDDPFVFDDAGQELDDLQLPEPRTSTISLDFL